MAMGTLKMTRSAYLFLVPAVGLYLLFHIYPFVETVIYSFTKWNGITKASFLGFENFMTLVLDKNFTESVGRIFIWAVLSIIFKVGSALIIAFVLRGAFRGIRFFRTIIFFPYIISASAMCLMFTIIYDKEIGIINKFLGLIGLDNFTRYWLSDPNTAFYAVIAVPIYQAIGYFFVILLAAMQDIPQELYDAAKIDGTNAIGEFFYVTIPYIWGTITVSIILAINGAFNDFNYVFILTGGGPGHASEVPATYMYKEIFINYKFGFGSAVALAIFALTITVTMTVRKALSGSFKTE